MKQAAPKATHEVTHPLADRLAQGLENGLRSDITAWRDRVSQARLTEVLEDLGPGSIDTYIPWTDLDNAFDPVRRYREEALFGSVAAVRPEFRNMLAGAAATIGGILALPSVLPFSTQHHGVASFMGFETVERIRALAQGSRLGMGQALQHPDLRLASASRLARTIRSSIGLDERQVVSVMTSHLRQLAAGVAPKIAERNALALAERYLTQRVRLIAGHETMEAVNQGAMSVWEQSADAGLFDRGRAKLVWVTVGDDKVCPICRPLDGMEVPFGGKFEGDLVRETKSGLTKFGGYSVGRPPVHVSCRCSLELRLS
jgi:hypothetical protein